MRSGNKWSEVNWLKAFVAALAAVLCMVSYLLLDEIDGPSAVVRFAQDVLPAAAVVLAAYLIGSYLFFRKGISSAQQLREEIVDAIVESSRPVHGLVAVYTEFADPPWDVLWSDAHEVVLVARYFDGIVHPITHSLEQFWRNQGANVKAIVPDPRSPSALQFAARQQRANLYRDDVLGRILRGLWAIERARESQGAAEGSLEIYLANDPIPYAGHCFDGEQLLLSPYEYEVEPANRAPRSHFLVSQSKSLSRFWGGEIEELTRGGSLSFAEFEKLVEVTRQREQAERATVVE